MEAGNHYEWQLYDGQQWSSICNDIVIETHYCQPEATGITIHTSMGSLYIDFDALTINEPFTNLSIRRITFLNNNQKQEVGWYYKDNNRWCEYGSQGSDGNTSSIGSDYIEQQYNNNPTGSVQFTAGNTTYMLDFTAMTQTNLSTRMRRKVRWRPKFNSIVMVNNSSPTLESPTTNSNASSTEYIWEFKGDKGIWTEYHKPGCSLDSADIERLYQLNPQYQVSFTAGPSTYTLYFSEMYQVNNTFGTKRQVRRIDSEEKIQQTNSVLSPVRWQFQGVDGNWKDYSKGGSWGHCSVSSQDIEAQYQQDSTGTMKFWAGRFNYELNFSDMSQSNLSTNTRRLVRRL
ncbi:uncharacterized protein si:ch211-244b2.3 [Xyrauchen texanus]|uniref:uncharacterized protein si:ch211-244b2.3 n=1 Tax=Xyrauchen texanus TaxID=154827 RepID=UPI0022426DE4|nr:uncharacterized protein si:ch211-244b2.3 [Xyrauchen texanus]